MQKNQDKKVVQKNAAGQTPGAKPQEKYGLHFSSSITIRDPESGKVLLKKRCN